MKCRARRKPSRRRSRAGASLPASWAFALRRNLADENVARHHFGADVDDARLVEVLQRFFRNVGYVARDFLRPELVSRAIASNSSIWIEVKTSSLTMRSESRIKSSKL